MNTCPCCSQQLLRHARQNSIYWFCSHCWQEMPNFSISATERKTPVGVNRLASSLDLVY